MRPYYRTEQPHETPRVTFAFIGLSTLAFLLTISLPPGPRAGITALLGLSRAALMPGGAGFPAGWLALLTAPFLHASWFQFFWNSLALLAVGPGIETRVRGRGLALLYLGAGAVGLLAQAGLGSRGVLFGGTAAAAGVLGWYLFDHARERLVVQLPFVPQPTRVIVWVVVAIWFALHIVEEAFGSGLNPGLLAGGIATGLLAAAAYSRWRTRKETKEAQPAVIRYNPYDNPEEEYRPYPQAQSKEEEQDEE